MYVYSLQSTSKAFSIPFPLLLRNAAHKLNFFCSHCLCFFFLICSVNLSSHVAKLSLESAGQVSYWCCYVWQNESNKNCSSIHFVTDMQTCLLKGVEWFFVLIKTVAVLNFRHLCVCMNVMLSRVAMFWKWKRFGAWRPHNIDANWDRLWIVSSKTYESKVMQKECYILDRRKLEDKWIEEIVETLTNQDLPNGMLPKS